MQFLDTRLVTEIEGDPTVAIELRSRSYGIIGHILTDGADGYNLVIEPSVKRDVGRIMADPVNLSHKAAEYLALALAEQLAHEGY